jgi:hypothetical protein
MTLSRCARYVKTRIGDDAGFLSRRPVNTHLPDELPV